MKKKLLTISTALLFSVSGIAQHTWFDLNASPSAINHIAFETAGSGTFTASVDNPDATDKLTNDQVARWSFPVGANVSAKQELTFSLPGLSAAQVNGTVLTVRLYISSATGLADIDAKRWSAENSRMRFYLGAKQDQFSFDPADEGKWVEYVTEYSAATETATVGNITLVATDPSATDITNGEVNNQLITEALDIYIDTYVSDNIDLGAVLSTNDVAKTNNDLKIVTNLVSDSLIFSKEIEGATIFNITGQVFKSLGNGTGFNVADLAAGVYIVKAKANNSYKTIKFIKK
jgi:hypothetical protein